jgi:hypothetical protein
LLKNVSSISFSSVFLLNELVAKEDKNDRIFRALVFPDELPPFKQRMVDASPRLLSSGGTFELRVKSISIQSLKQKKFFAPNFLSTFELHKRGHHPRLKSSPCQILTAKPSRVAFRIKLTGRCEQRLALLRRQTPAQSRQLDGAALIREGREQR